MAETILEGYSDREKGAYLGAIASIATADHSASPEELEHIEALCDAAELSDQQKQAVVQAATELTGEELNKCLDILKESDLRFSLVTDLIAFAKSDGQYSGEEEQNIKKISTYLGVDQKQFTLLDQFSDEAGQQASVPEPERKQGILGGGLHQALGSSGINSGSLLKGVLGIAAPLLLSGMLSRGLGRRSGGLGGFGGMGMGMGGGLGSIIGMLSGGRGMSSTGGLFGRMFGGGGW